MSNTALRTRSLADEWAPTMLSVLRIVSALVFLLHGTQKLLNFPVRTTGAAPAMFSQFWFGGILEMVGGTLLLIGLFTRPVAFVLPSSHVFEGMRAALGGTVLWGELGWAAAFNVVWLGVFALVFALQFRQARMRGALLNIGE